MWWDGVWAGCRLDSGVCPIYKHTDLDITYGVNEVKVLPKELFLTLMLCKQSDHYDYHSRYAPREPSARRGLRSNPAGSGCDRLVSELKVIENNSPPPNPNAGPVIDPATIALATLLSTQLTSQLKDVIPEMINRIQGHGNNTGHTTGEASGNTSHTSDCSYKSFVGCKPPSFTGVEGAVGLIQWLEKMENTLDISSSPEHHKVRYAAGSFSKRELTWWNAQIRARG
ncbi:hypothetical protein E3N88_18342 [Mikania micrantha]|uniref:Reverse transcriptase domain-containing protein n=1 Tax=Mikania micrantha TaxID=192012 RepID=A0A5N6NUL8_9ASTR|nr:hypothetical protein E3N88_18342 [Mikania micrantha]